MKSWNEFYLGMAAYVATKSKDPSTKVGAVIVRPDHTLASIGFNGFPRHVADTPERYADRDYKLAVTVHAEANAILNAREPLHGYTMYTTFSPCCACASLIIQSGIGCVVVAGRGLEDVPNRWYNNMAIANTIMREARIIVCDGAGS